MKKDCRDKLVDGGYWLPLLFGLVLTMIFGAAYGQTPREVRAELTKQNVKHVDIVTAQSILETGWYNCKPENCSMRYNNIFGFRLSSKAEPGNKLGYLKFDTWQESVAYYKTWQDKHYESGCYYEFLVARGYAEDTMYVQKLKSVIKKIN